MKNKIILILFICLTFGCSDDKTDEALLEKDRIELEKSLDSYKVWIHIKYRAINSVKY